tara:strand:- start:323 stop:646 length:324 start_codon:yes stop_codon:yes gene_type:complete
VFVKEHLTDNKITIKVMTLKTFILENEIKEIDLLKIDTEGKDYDIIIEYFKDPIILPKCIITEDIVKGHSDLTPQLLIAERKKEFLIKNNYDHSVVDEYNSKYILKK